MKTHKLRIALEELESRHSPATLVNPTTLVYTDIDGDQVTLTSSRGQFVLSTPNGTISETFALTAANAIGGQQLHLMNLLDPGFHGADITMSVLQRGTGDGLAAIGLIRGGDLGAVTIKGDLGEIDCGDANTSTPAIRSLSVRSMGRYGDATDVVNPGLSSEIRGAVGALRVDTDVKDAAVSVIADVDADGTIGSITIGGSLIGGAGDFSGTVFAEGDIGSVKIGRHITGSVGESSGQIGAGGSMGNVTIGGSIVGGAHDDTGTLSSVGAMGAVKVSGNVLGGTGNYSGRIAAGAIANLRVGGSLVGSDGFSSGAIATTGEMGPVGIAHNVKGGGGNESGKIDAGGKLRGVTIGGSLLGGRGDYDTETSGGVTHIGQIFSGGQLGIVRIRHDVRGDSGDYSAAIVGLGDLAGVTIGGSLLGGPGASSASIAAMSLVGNIGHVRVGQDWRGGSGPGMQSAMLFSGGKTASVAIGGSLIGGQGDLGAVIAPDDGVALVRIGHDLVGGKGTSAGVIANARSVIIKGSLLGGAGHSAGAVLSKNTIDSVRIGHDLVGGSLGASATEPLEQSGHIRSQKRIASIIIGGSIIAGNDQNALHGITQSASVVAGEDIGSLVVKGGLIGNRGGFGDSFVDIIALGQVSPGASSDLAIGKVSIGGRAEYARILAGFDRDVTGQNADAQIGSLHVGGDWVASSVVAGAVNLGFDDSPGGLGANADNIHFGDGHDKKIAEADDAPGIISRIGSITIAGRVFGTPASIISADVYGFVAEQIGAVRVGGRNLVLDRAPNTDAHSLSRAGDFTLHEIDADFPAVPTAIASARLVNPSTVTYEDVDGDLVQVTLSKPLLNDGNASNVFKFDGGTVDNSIPSRLQLQLIDLTPLADDGLGVAVKVISRRGDGLANVGYINATGFNLGSIAIAGDLGQIDAGNGTAGVLGIQSLSVRTLGRLGTDTQISGAPATNLRSDINGGVGALTVAQDVVGATPFILGPVDAITIGGSLIGGSGSLSGSIIASSINKLKIRHHVQAGNGLGSGMVESGTSIGTAIVGGSIIGGMVNGDGTTLGQVAIAHNVLSGFVSANKDVGRVTIGGSLIGGAGDRSGRVSSSGGVIGAVSIGHNLIGGLGSESGQVAAFSKLNQLSIRGSLIGGDGEASGRILGKSDAGTVRVGGNLIGGGGGDSGSLHVMGNFDSLSFRGSLIGDGGGSSGVVTVGSNIESLAIGHDVLGGGGGQAGRIQAIDFGNVIIRGSLVGGGGSGTGELNSDGSIVSLRIGHDQLGGPAVATGNVICAGEVQNMLIGGSLIGGRRNASGGISASQLGNVQIGRDVIGGSIFETQDTLVRSGFIETTRRIGEIRIRGSMIAGINGSVAGVLKNSAAIVAGDDIGSIRVDGSLIGNSNPNGSTPVVISARGQPTPNGDVNVAIGRISIGGNVERTNIFGGYDTNLEPTSVGVQVGEVTVRGDWIASNLVVGVRNRGADDASGGSGANADNVNFGDVHDTFVGLGSVFNRIENVDISGIINGTATAGDHFGFSSYQIGSFKLRGSMALLDVGQFSEVIELSPLTSDVSIREL